MNQRRPAEPDAELLPSKVAERLLQRASELDATGAAVADLRAAAAEAGISNVAFDAALAEMREAKHQPVVEIRSKPRNQRMMGALTAAIAAIVAVGMLAVFRTVAPVKLPAPSTVSMLDKTFPLRCISGDQAAALVRPLLDLRGNTVVVSARAPGVLTVHATSEQITKVQSLLDQYERPGSASCASAPTPAPRP